MGAHPVPKDKSAGRAMRSCWMASPRAAAWCLQADCSQQAQQVKARVLGGLPGLCPYAKSGARKAASFLWVTPVPDSQGT